MHSHSHLSFLFATILTSYLATAAPSLTPLVLPRQQDANIDTDSTTGLDGIGYNETELLDQLSEIQHDSLAPLCSEWDRRCICSHLSNIQSFPEVTKECTALLACAPEDKKCECESRPKDQRLKSDCYGIIPCPENDAKCQCQSAPPGTPPDDKCFPFIGRPGVAPAAWGGFLENSGEGGTVDSYYTDGLDLGSHDWLFITCTQPIVELCKNVAEHADDIAANSKWVFAGSLSPGCLVGMWLPNVNHIPWPNMGWCGSFFWQMEVQMTNSTDTRVSDATTRISVNLGRMPSLPDVTGVQGNPTTNAWSKVIETSDNGVGVNGSIHSMFIQAFNNRKK